MSELVSMVCVFGTNELLVTIYGLAIYLVWLSTPCFPITVLVLNYIAFNDRWSCMFDVIGYFHVLNFILPCICSILTISLLTVFMTNFTMLGSNLLGWWDNLLYKNLYSSFSLNTFVSFWHKIAISMDFWLNGSCGFCNHGPWFVYHGLCSIHTMVTMSYHTQKPWLW